MTDTKHGRFTSAFWRSFTTVALSVPIAANAVEINNGIPEGTLGHYRVDVRSGGETQAAFVTQQAFTSGNVVTADVVFDYASFADTGPNGQRGRLTGSDPVPDPNNPNRVSSSGTFAGANGNTIVWTATSVITPGSQVMTTRYTFSTDDGSPIGPLRFLQYLDEDAIGASDDVFSSVGTASSGTLALLTFDNTQVIGVNHSGAFVSPFGLENGVFAGWAAGRYPLMRNRISDGTQSVLVEGAVEDALAAFGHPQLGTVFGPADITSVLAWDVGPNASSAAVTTSLGGTAASVGSTQVRCRRSVCPVPVSCNLAQVQGAAQCTNQVTVFVRPRDVRARDALAPRANRPIRLAVAVANIPAGQTVNVPVRLTKRGKEIVRTSTRRQVRGVIEIRDTIGTVISATPVRIRLR